MSDQAGQSPASFYSSPLEALQAPPEELVYVACLHVGTGVDKPDFLAVVDVNPDSDEYGRIVRPARALTHPQRLAHDLTARHP